ncbi:MAG: winged helix-turn-helix transcriptional regulator [Granulosicoccus sp.]
MTKRSYKQNCALAQANDVIGERWSLLLVRDLLVGPKRFGELQQSLRGIGSNLLVSRLRELESAGIVERLEEAENRHRYGLTDAGIALEPTLLSLVRWGLTYGPRNQRGYHHQDDWDLLAMKALFQANRAGDLSVCVQFETRDFAGWVAIKNHNVKVGLGQADSADLIVYGTIKDLFFDSRGDKLCSSRSKKTLKRFMSVFTLPG